jgi:DNA adenine methylase
VKALFTYTGGKARQAKWISDELDKCPHSCYFEPFAGAASIFFCKKRAKINILNDYNYNIVSIFKALRDHGDEFRELINLMEYSEFNYKESKRLLQTNDLPLVRRAVYMTFIHNCCCGRTINSTSIPRGFSHGTAERNTTRAADHLDHNDNTHHGFTFGASRDHIANHLDHKDNTRSSFAHGTLEINAIHAANHLDNSKYQPFINKLQGVQILNRDALTIIPKFDLPNVLIYIDPPYENVREAKRQYTDIDHDKLCEILLGFKKAKWAISNYSGGAYDERYKGYRCITRESRNNSICNTKACQEKLKDNTVIESLWLNW